MIIIIVMCAWYYSFMFILHTVWDFMGFVLISYDGVSIPMSFFDPPIADLQDFMSWVSRFFWTIDVVCSFLTGYLKSSGKLEMCMIPVAKHYFRNTPPNRAEPPPQPFTDQTRCNTYTQNIRTISQSYPNVIPT